ncbi:MAG: catechol 2,3-dioxygenase [Thermoleophilia bacterium]
MTRAINDGRSTIEAKPLPRVELGPVSLTVSNLERELRFYETALGLRVIFGKAEKVLLAAGGKPLVELVERPGAARVRPSAGLYHLALRYPRRGDLGRVLLRLSERGAGILGASDHGVSEAVYLSDPEGNGIELYWDRPREEWPTRGGQIRFSNGPLDIRALVALAQEESERLEPGPSESLDNVVLGHVHLQVGDLEAADRFYVDLLGFEKKAEFPGQAHFVAAGDYHHHLAYNVWAGRGVVAPPPGSRGLRFFTLLLPSEEDLQQLLGRLREARRPEEKRRVSGAEGQEGVLVHDPSGNGVLLAAQVGRL